MRLRQARHSLAASVIITVIITVNLSGNISIFDVPSSVHELAESSSML